jgi:hypothetical protein
MTKGFKTSLNIWINEGHTWTAAPDVRSPASTHARTHVMLDCMIKKKNILEHMDEKRTKRNLDGCS